jgi:glycosyltransferase involved in cell wall biosynthesis
MPRKEILFIHHCGVFGGASRSLGELVTAMPGEEIFPIIISQRGTAADYFRKKDFAVIEVSGLSKFDVTELGHYRGFRWLIIFRELFYLPATLRSLLKAKKMFPDIQLVHINDVQDFLCSFFIKRIFHVPVVIHIRGPLMTRRGWRFRFLMWSFRNSVDQVITIDQTVKNTVDPSVEPQVIHNGFAINHSQAVEKLNSAVVTIGMVSNMLRFKGVLEFIEAAHICKQKGIPVRFEILGGKNETKGGLIHSILGWFGLQHNIEREVVDKIKKYQLGEMVSILPFNEKIDSFYQRISVLCFPSHINAVGRPVFEAGFFKVPSIVAITNPQPDAIIHMQTGICIEAKNPQSLASAVLHFCNQPSEITRMGENAYQLAINHYSVSVNSKKILRMYDSIIQSAE